MLDSSAVVDASVGGAQNAFSEVGAAGGNQLAQLIEQFGRTDVNGAIGNILGFTFGDLIKQVINDSPLPDFLKDAAGEAIDGAVADERAVSTPEAEEAIQDEMGEAMMDLIRGMTQAADEMMKEEAEGGTESGVSGGGKGLAGGNWLVALAKALGEVAGEHLGRSVALAGEISENAGAGGEGPEAQQAQAEKMTALQAEMQAETQMFKLAQEGLTTIIKNVGEALSSTARKQ